MTSSAKARVSWATCFELARKIRQRCCQRAALSTVDQRHRRLKKRGQRAGVACASLDIAQLPANNTAANDLIAAVEDIEAGAQV
jgi:hypothetical protein